MFFYEEAKFADREKYLADSLTAICMCLKSGFLLCLYNCQCHIMPVERPDDKRNMFGWERTIFLTFFDRMHCALLAFRLTGLHAAERTETPAWSEESHFRFPCRTSTKVSGSQCALAEKSHRTRNVRATSPNSPFSPQWATIWQLPCHGEVFGTHHWVYMSFQKPNLLNCHHTFSIVWWQYTHYACLYHNILVVGKAVR